jgi:N-acetylmuramoyl-L-alanine amidase
VPARAPDEDAEDSWRAYSDGVSDPISATCKKTYYPAFRKSGTRALSQILWIVLHDEEAPTAEAAARYFKSATASGSAHLCVDDKECFRCLPDTAIPWGAPGANTNGFHIEQAGYARWSSVIWRSHLRTLKLAAYKTAYHCHEFGIPARFVGADGLRARRRGITTHRKCGKAFGGSHRDPGYGWPGPLFMALVRRYLKAMG